MKDRDKKKIADALFAAEGDKAKTKELIESAIPDSIEKPRASRKQKLAIAACCLVLALVVAVGVPVVLHYGGENVYYFEQANLREELIVELDSILDKYSFGGVLIGEENSSEAFSCFDEDKFIGISQEIWVMTDISIDIGEVLIYKNDLVASDIEIGEFNNVMYRDIELKYSASRYDGGLYRVYALFEYKGYKYYFKMDSELNNPPTRYIDLILQQGGQNA